MTQKKAESRSAKTARAAMPVSPTPAGNEMSETRLAWGWLVAAIGSGIEALALVVLALMAIYGVISGGASTTTRALTEGASLLILGFGVAFLSANLLRHKSLAKTPTLLWNAILVLLSFSVMTGGAPLAGVLTLVIALCTFIAALFVPRFELDDDTLI